MKHTALLFFLLLIILLGACLPIDWSALGDKLNPLPRSPRKVYEKDLRKNQPDSTYLWLGAAERALQTAALPEPPFRERGLLTADRPEAVGYRFRLAAGEALRFSLLPPFPAREVFGEVYRITGTTDSVEQFEEVAYWDSTTYRLEFEARRPGDYLFRLQGKLGTTIPFDLYVNRYPPLRFPVAGAGNRDIQSFWGAERDGGRRRHEGIDIFAPRGTPVVAVADGRVTSVGNGGLGGKTVWQRAGDRGINLYYAHLDTQLVGFGRRVQVGDTLGLVGNTGNARTTAPHLHFGIYGGSGAVDPLPFVKLWADDPPALTADTTLLGGWAETTGAANFRPQATTKSTPLEQLPAATPAWVIAAQAAYCRIRLTDGRTGYVAASLLRPAAAPPVEEVRVEF